ncbi:MAG: hypothetical protein K0R92_2055, partial [Lachnospiraceae bacterium]|nr:hypothetical protein [Anaerocolumna sp.]MDF2610581.1 hypothetical protein [Lachnospiraceae bacterium]
MLDQYSSLDSNQIYDVYNDI